MMFQKTKSVEKRPKQTSYCHLFLFLMLSTYHCSAPAREWYVKPNASSQLIYDTNLQLRAERTVTTNGVTRALKPEEAYGGTLQAGGVMGSQTENNDIHIRGNVSFNRYNISNFNSVNFFLFPEASLNVTPKDKLGVSGKLFLDTTLSRERPSVIDDTPLDLNETDNLLGVPRRRFTKSIRPDWSHALSEKTTLNLSYEFTDVTFENAAKTGRLDYNIHTGQLNLSHQLTPKLLIFSNTSATLFSTPDIDSSTTYYSVQVGGQYKFSERWEAEVVGGGRYSFSEFRARRLSPIISPDGQLSFEVISDKDSNSGLGSLASASLSHYYTEGRVKLSVTQDIRPTGNGSLQTSNQAAINWTHRLSEYLDFSLPVSALRGSSINTDSNFLDRTYYQVGPMLRWKLSPEFSLGLRYRYRYQKFDNLENSADSHSAMLTASYQWQRQSLSR